MSKRKPYIPSKKTNPVIFAKKIERINSDLEKQKQLHDIRYSNLQNYFGKLTNFTSHDIKNAVHNMDGVVSTIDIRNVTEEEIQSLKTSLNAIRKSLDDFYKLSPDGRKVEFTMLELAKTIEILNKAALNKDKIKYEFKFDKSNETIIHQPFHSIIQVLNNLIINSIRALNDIEIKKVLVTLEIIEDEVNIKVCDNGCGITNDIKDKIFDIYFTQTGGSGIGLAHAVFALSHLNGTVKLIESNVDFNTIFEIKFPLQST